MVKSIFSVSEAVNAYQITTGVYGSVYNDMGVGFAEANVQTWNGKMRREVRISSSYKPFN
jgi:hypothetical protein